MAARRSGGSASAVVTSARTTLHHIQEPLAERFGYIRDEREAVVLDEQQQCLLDEGSTAILSRSSTIKARLLGTGIWCQQDLAKGLVLVEEIGNRRELGVNHVDVRPFT